MTAEQLELYANVIDTGKRSYGVGLIERIDETSNLIYVWYDEVETMVHYGPEDIKFLEEI